MPPGCFSHLNKIILSKNLTQVIHTPRQQRTLNTKRFNLEPTMVNFLWLIFQNLDSLTISFLVYWCRNSYLNVLDIHEFGCLMIFLRVFGAMTGALGHMIHYPQCSAGCLRDWSRCSPPQQLTMGLILLEDWSRIKIFSLCIKGTLYHTTEASMDDDALRKLLQECTSSLMLPAQMALFWWNTSIQASMEIFLFLVVVTAEMSVFLQTLKKMV